MSQVSYGTITITDTNDIESITVEYNRNQSSSNAPAATDSGWSTTRPDWAQGYYIWQRTRVHKSGTTADKDVIGTAVCITGSTGSTGAPGAPGRGLTNSVTQYCNYGTGEPADNYSGWTDAPPNYDSSKPNYWVMITNTYSVAPTPEIIKYKDEALTKAVSDSAVANSIAQHANEDAQGAMSQAASNVNEVKRIWYVQAAATPVPNAPTTGVTTSAAHDAWSITKPAANESYQYYFYCDQTKTGGGIYSWSEVILDTSTLSQYQIGAMSAKVRNYWWDSAGAHIASGTSTSGEISATSPISSYGYNTLTGLTGISFKYNDAKVVDLNSTTPSLDFYQPPTISGNTVTQGNKTMMLSANALRFYNPSDGTTEQATLNANGLKLLKGGIEAGTPNQSGFIYLSTEPYGSYSISNSTGITDWKEIIGTKFGVREDGTLYASNAVISGQITVGSGSNVYTTTEVDEAFESKGSAIEEINKYVTSIGDTGIKVHPYNDTTSTVDQNNYTKINTEGMEIFKDSVSISKFGEVTRIGTENDASITITDSSILGVGEDKKAFFNFSNSDAIIEIPSISISYSNRNVEYFPSREERPFTWSFNDYQGKNITKIFFSMTYYSTPRNGKSLRFDFGTSVTTTISLTFSDEISHIIHVKYDGAYKVTAWLDEASQDEGVFSIGEQINTIEYLLAPSYEMGGGVEATGGFAFAEGYSTQAKGNYSHACGKGTIASQESQFVIGQYNIEDVNSDSHLLIIGNGYSDSNRSNAFTVDWSGNIDIASGAKYKINGTNLAPSDLGEADYVTAQGTSGAWKYRKWNSGKVEAWAYISFTSTTPAVWASPIRYIDKTFTIPSGIFASTPRMTGSSNSNQYWAVDVSASSSTVGSVRFCTVASSALTPYIQIYAWTD